MLEFNKQLHEYRYSGVKIPSVTQIISDVGLSNFGGVNKRMMQIAQERGTFVHLACELYDKGQLDEATVDVELLGYLEAWKAFCNDFKPKFIEIEKKYYSELGFAGTIDRLAVIGKDSTLIDIKTGGKSQAHEVQSGAYSIFVNPLSSLTVYLSKDGKYKVEPQNIERGKAVFLYSLEIYKYKHRG